MKKELRELISYIFVGSCTTAVNFIIYWFFIKVINQGWLVANIISWIGAVIFAFWANKRYVFKSINESTKEAWQFFILRLATLVIESILLFVFIQLLSVNEMFSKLGEQYLFFFFLSISHRVRYHEHLCRSQISFLMSETLME